ncbi:MAG: type II toxin-antitoxin system VapC family toxin [Chitinophagales bacterium]
MKIFLDVKSLVKLYILESGTNLILDVVSKSDQVFLSQASTTQFRAFVWQKAHQGIIDNAQAVTIIDCFEQDSSYFQWIELDNAIINSANQLMMQYGISSNISSEEAIQLASAFTLNKDRIQFVTSNDMIHKILDENGFHTITTISPLAIAS